MEYLFAAVLADYINKDKVPSAGAILRSTNASIQYLLRLPVSIGFLTEMIEPKIDSSYKESISTTQHRNKIERAFATRLLNVITGDGISTFNGRVDLFFNKKFRITIISGLNATIRGVDTIIC